MFCCEQCRRHSPITFLAWKSLYDSNVTDSCSTNPHHRCIDVSLQWRQNGRNGVSNNQPHDCLLNRLFRRRSKKTSKLRVTGLCAGNSPVTGEFPAQMASNTENVSIWWRHHVCLSQGIQLIISHLCFRYWHSAGPCGLTTNHYLSQRWHILLMHICVTQSQWINVVTFVYLTVVSNKMCFLHECCVISQ